MSAPTRFDDTFVAGDTYDLVVSTNKIVEGGSATLHIRSKPEQPPLVISNAISLAEGKITFKLSQTDTKKLDSAVKTSQNFVHQIQFTSSAGDIYTIASGHFRVLKDLNKT